MTRREKGVLAEAKALAHFIAGGWEVFLPYAECGACDMIVAKGGRLSRVSVKYTSTGAGASWEVELRSVSRRNHGAVAVKHFDAAAADLLAIYIGPEDRVAVLEAALLRGRRCVSIRKVG